MNAMEETEPIVDHDSGPRINGSLHPCPVRWIDLPASSSFEFSQDSAPEEKCFAIEALEALVARLVLLSCSDIPRPRSKRQHNSSTSPGAFDDHEDVHAQWCFGFGLTASQAPKRI